MARLKNLPSLDIIRAFKGTIDFVVWKGQPYARGWPRKPTLPRSPASTAAAIAFGVVIQNYRLLAPLALAAFQRDALGQPRTARDLYITATYGRLHEATMSDFLTLLTECRDFLANLQALLNALTSVATDSLLTEVIASALPDGAATELNQNTQITSLHVIEDLRHALLSIDTDRLVVRGEDQLFSFAGPIDSVTTGQPSGASGYKDSHPVPAGQIWVVTTVAARDRSAALTHTVIAVRHAGFDVTLKGELRAIAQWEWVSWSGTTYLTEGAVIRVTFSGCGAGDTVDVHTNGHVMTLEA